MGGSCYKNTGEVKADHSGLRDQVEFLPGWLVGLSQGGIMNLLALGPSAFEGCFLHKKLLHIVFYNWVGIKTNTFMLHNIYFNLKAHFYLNFKRK